MRRIPRSFLPVLALVALGSLGWQLAVHGQEEAPAPDGLAGTWEGEVTYANGREGRVEITLEEVGDGLWEGPYVFTMATEDAPETYRSRARIRMEDGRITDFTVIDDRRSEEIEVDARLAPASPYAEAACLGRFEEGGRPGVFCIWRFAN